MTTKFFTTTFIALAATVSSFAQTDTGKTSNVHIGFIYPISSNGLHAKEYTNTFSVHAIAGVSANEKSLCASGVSNVVANNATGLTAAGVVNYVGNNATGVEAAGLLNIAVGNIKGLQAAGFMNLAGSVTGIQTAGFANIADSSVNGPQLAGFANIAEAADVQGAGFINVAESVSGVQVAGFANIAQDVNTQLGGFINVAGKVKGVQIAGFINIADSSEYPIGLVNIIKKGEQYLGMTVDESLTTLVSFRSGGRILYGIVGGGYNFKTDDYLYALEAGIGAHFPVSKSFRINMEATCTSITDFWSKAHFKSTLRMTAAVKLGQHLEVFAGPTINMIDYDSNKSEGFVNHYLWTESRWGNFYGVHIGAIGGIQFKF